MGLVQHVLSSITDEFAKKVAAHSVPAVMAAQPIDPLPDEQLPGAFQYVHHSPEQMDLDQQFLQLQLSPDPGRRSRSPQRHVGRYPAGQQRSMAGGALGDEGVAHLGLPGTGPDLKSGGCHAPHMGQGVEDALYEDSDDASAGGPFQSPVGK